MFLDEFINLLRAKQKGVKRLTFLQYGISSVMVIYLLNHSLIFIYPFIHLVFSVQKRKFRQFSMRRCFAETHFSCSD